MARERRAADTIANWTQARLVKFIQTILATDPAALPSSIEGEEFRARTKLTVDGDLELSPQALQYIKDNLPP